MFFQHMERKFRDVKGDVIKSDSGLWLVPFDGYGLAPMRKHVPSLEKAFPANCDNEGPYCGWPFFFPMLPFMK